MGYKPVGVDDSTSLFPPRVMTAIRKLFPSVGTLTSKAKKSGSIIGWCGDSHTVGTGATNAYGAFPKKSSDFAGGLVISPYSVNGGVGGENSSQLLVRIPGIISSGAQTLFVLIGTNDAGQGVSVASYAANIQAIKALADQANVGFSIGTVPPRLAGQPAGAIALTNSYNMWLRTWTATNGILLVDVWGALVDITLGTTRADLNSDGVHLNDAGHLEMAKVIAAGLSTIIQAPIWPINSAGLGLTADPMATNAVPQNSARWDFVAGYYAEIVVAPLDAATTSTYSLPAGRWIRFSHNNTSGSTRYSTYRKTVDLTKFSAGDKLLFLMYVRASEPNALNKVEVRDASSSLGLAIDGMAIANPGPVAFTYTVPATKPGELQISFTQAAPTGRTTWVDIGTADVLNMTTLGVNFNGM